MYDIKQFKPTLYVLILMGFTGFAMAAEQPGLWVLAVTLALLNAWLVYTGKFTPLPRLLSSAVTLLSIIYVLSQWRGGIGNQILSAGEFLVFLQLVKLWEQRANRDYAQLLALSLLLMVAAAISTASLLFGILLIGYLFFSLYCCLLFHLKVESDEARLALATPPERVNPTTLNQDQQYLSRSMRRLTGLVASFAIVSAIVIFLFFPRGAGAGMFGQFQWKHQDPLTGFSDQVSFQQVAKITQNNDVVATVKVWKDDIPLQGDQTLLLRGVTHQVYDGKTYEWIRADTYQHDDHKQVDLGREDWRPKGVVGAAHFKQVIDLSNPTGTNVIFALAGPLSIEPTAYGVVTWMDLRYSPVDGTLQNADPLTRPFSYTVYSSGSLGDAVQNDQSNKKSDIDPKIAQYARRNNVSGGLAARRLALAAAQSPVDPRPTELDEPIARAIENHLRSTFTYTLDLTDAYRIADRDPVVAFLYDFKRGHCEYFASAMTLMCQSLGMQARMVVGFKCDEYNNFIHCYTVRESQAHAWVEVLTTKGWQTFDPTSGQEATRRQASLWQDTKNFFDYLQYTWANAVIAYDANNRENLIATVDNHLTKPALQGFFAMRDMQDLFDRLSTWLATSIIKPLIALLVVAMAAAIGWYFYERWKLRRRASRIGIDALPASAQMRLIRQLGFYDNLLRLLERHQIVRPKHLTPLEFSDSLAYLPSGAYDIIRRLTALFYRIRYGQAELDAGQQKRLNTVIDRLAQKM